MGSESIIAGKRCRLYGDGDALLIQAVDRHELAALDREAELIEELSCGAPFTLAAFSVENWNRELSPWEAPAVFAGGEDFGAGAAETLAFITDGLLPQLGERTRCYLGGYSLSGLFALWSAYQTDLFSGVAAVSPSVWFPQWDSYIARRHIRAPRVYLSLGQREERTRNAAMARVGSAIRLQHERLSLEESCAECVLEWNPGNHFADPERRMARGFAWLLRNE